MIIIEHFYEWYVFLENVNQYTVLGTVMAEPDPTTGEPIIHDIKIKEIWDNDQEKDLTFVVDHDMITSYIEQELF